MTRRGQKTMLTKKPRQGDPRPPASRNAEVLDVHMAAGFLTVSPDTVYELFKSGELPACKVGRKWITTKAAILRWIEESCAADAAVRVLKNGDQAARARVLKSGTVRVKGRA